MPKLLIMVGLPFSNRESYSRSLKNLYTIISRDVCREYLFGPHYDLSPKEEIEVDKDFAFRLGKAYLSSLDIVLNNTNCSEQHIDKIIAECPIQYDIRIKFFNVSIFHMFIRNYARYLIKGRWIPMKILFQLRKGFKKINKSKYSHYSDKFVITQKTW